MKKGIFWVLAMGLMVLGAATNGNAQGGPVVDKVWVSPETNYGQKVKIYIKATDSEGDMQWLFVSAGRGTDVQGCIPIRIKKEFGKELNGYLFWDSSRAMKKNVEGTVEITIEDRKGQESPTQSLTVKIVEKGAKSQKAPAEFQEVPIAPLTLESPQYGGGQ